MTLTHRIQTWYRQLLAQALMLWIEIQQRAQPVPIASAATDASTPRSGNADTQVLVIDPILTQGATIDWSPLEATGEHKDFIQEREEETQREEDRLLAEHIDRDAAYLEYLHHQLLNIEHAVLTDFNVAVNRALYKFGMTQQEMLGAAVLHERSGEQELVRA